MKKFKKAVLPVILSASVITLAGCSQGSSENYVSTKIGNVTQKDVLDYIGSQQLSKSAVNLATRKILLDKYGKEVDSAYIDKAYEKIQAQNGGKESFEALLLQQGLTADKYKEDLKIKVTQAYMINEYANITEEKIKEQYEKEKKQYNIAHILISVKSDNTPNGISEEDAKAKAEEVLAKINSGEDFATLAKEYSTDLSNSSNGGELGWSAKENTSFVSEFANVAYSLNKGEVSELVKTPFGYHIIKVLDTKEVPYNELKNEIVEKLAHSAVTSDPTVYSKSLQKLFDEYQVKGDTNEIKSYISGILNTSK